MLPNGTGEAESNFGHGPSDVHSGRLLATNDIRAEISAPVERLRLVEGI